MENSKLTNVLLAVIAVGIWIIALKSFAKGDIGTQPVEVVNTVDVSGRVDVDGSVSVDNTVDINISEINGQSDVFFNNPARGHDDKYYRLPITGN